MCTRVISVQQCRLLRAQSQYSLYVSSIAPSSRELACALPACQLVIIAPKHTQRSLPPQLQRRVDKKADRRNISPGPTQHQGASARAAPLRFPRRGPGDGWATAHHSEEQEAPKKYLQVRRPNAVQTTSRWKA